MTDTDQSQAHRPLSTQQTGTVIIHDDSLGLTTKYTMECYSLDEREPLTLIPLPPICKPTPKVMKQGL